MFVQTLTSPDAGRKACQKVLRSVAQNAMLKQIQDSLGG